ncbi:hypothetical protein GGI11_002314 [Coemansia sp. RSA 2049]|nr:hypothetical protein GGI11_002314 [Coemansia sp. RSA 2049]
MSSNQTPDQTGTSRQTTRAPSRRTGATTPTVVRGRPLPSTPQSDSQTAVDSTRLALAEMRQDRESLEALWQELVASGGGGDARALRSSEGGVRRIHQDAPAAAVSRQRPPQPPQSQQLGADRWESLVSPPWMSLRHPSTLGNDGNSSDGSAGRAEDDPTTEGDWTFVNMHPWLAAGGSSASSPPRTRRRLSGVRRTQWAPTADPSAAAAADASEQRGYEITYEERVADGSDGSSADEQQQQQRGRQRSDQTDDSEDMLASTSGLDYEQLFLRNPIGSTLWRMIMARENGAGGRTRTADALHNRRPTPRASPGTTPAAVIASAAPASVVVRQPWNKETVPWRPYVYQQPLPNINSSASSNIQVRNAADGYKHQTLPGTDSDRTKEYSVHSGVRVLPVDCTNADDMGRGTLDNMFTTNSTLYITSRTENVHLELSLAQPTAQLQHCVIERILVRSSMASPPCCELMAFASSRRCTFSEFARYDDFTFEKYERLASKFQGNGAGHLPVDDPVPIAYFWLSEEEEYQQLQILPQGMCCRFLYLKLLRGRAPNQRMSLRLVRVFGWCGPRAFAETTIC